MTRQRFAIEVPTPSTSFGLGVQNWNGTGYDGVSAVTVANFAFIGTTTSSTMTLQSGGQVMIHSTNDNLTSYAGGDALFGSDGTTYVSATSKVFVSAGASGAQHPSIGMFNQPGPNPAVPVSQMTAQLSETQSKVNKVIADTELGLIALAVLGFAFGKTQDAGSLYVGLLQLALAGLSKTLSPDFIGDLHAYGAESATISSAKNINVACLDTITIMTPQFVGISAGIQASMTGLLAAGVTAGFAAGLTGYFKAEVLGGMATKISARRGPVEIRGSSVRVGDAVPPFPQAATDDVTLRAKKSIDQSVGGAVASTVSRLDGTGLAVTGDTHTITAGKSATVASGMMSFIVSKGGVSLVRSSEEVFNDLCNNAHAALDAAKKAANEAKEASQLVAIITEAFESYTAAEEIIKQATVTYDAAIATAKATHAAAIKAALEIPMGVLRIGIIGTTAEMTNGLAKISLELSGAITIDGGGQPITIKSGAGSITVSAAGVKIKPLIDQG